MKRYLVFTYDDYYPSGGFNDFKLQTDNLELAKYVCDDAENGHVLDTVEGKIAHGDTGFWVNIDLNKE